ncbi:hypothetical protein BACCIP111899_02965 [Bacillus rhizoplanae]|uniref:Amino acid transporter n=1 Tax=Bacillus rhizoplanae TaxID=2880966 RepID=A0ABM8YDK5_9BACI|nr:hypothetical protein BACCIP111899_02965 [Bacillus rhizoplanae]
MSETIMICLYIVFGISAIFGLIKEFQKPEKKHSMILFEILILIAVIFTLYGILI